jgi:pimeloyl-ACP methyl ester carboxylesterase
LEAPVLMLWGREDRLAPAEHAEAFAETVAHARVEVLENCGHYPQLELPGRITATIREFLDAQVEQATAPAAVRPSAAQADSAS